MGKIFKVIINCILVLTIIVLVAYFTLRAMDRIRIYNVETGSMEDKIHSGDYILLIKKDDYRIGDVVTFTVDDYFITHRIISIENDKIVTKGDANNLEDSEITKDQIVGKAIYWGGVLNYIINFKYAIAAVLIGLYLLSCYFGEDKENLEIKDEINEDDEPEIIEEKIEEIKDEENNEEKIEEIIEESIVEEVKEEIKIEENKKEEVNDEDKIEEIIEEPIAEEVKEEIKENKPKRGRPKKKTEEVKLPTKTKKRKSKKEK